MTKTLLTLLLLWSFLLWSYGLTLPASAAPSYETTTNTAAEDGTGTVWALPDYVHQDGGLRRWQTGGWIGVSVPGAGDFAALAMTRGGDGSVYVLWQKRNQAPTETPQCLVTTQCGSGSRVLARFDGPVVRRTGSPYLPTLFAGRGDLWIAGSLPLLRHISATGIVQTFPLKPDEFFGGQLPGDFDPPALDSLTDGTGRRWFWQGASQNHWQPGSLRGVLIWSGKTLDYHADLPGVPDQIIAGMTPLDAGHFWLATGQDYRHPPSGPCTLYRVDTRTLHGVREPGQPAFQNIYEVFTAGGDVYVADKLQNNRATLLWREHAGKWSLCLPKLEQAGAFSRSDGHRPWLLQPSGLWIGAGGGAWWLPRGGTFPPVWVDWRRGLPPLDISGLFPLAGKRMLALADTGGAAEVPESVHGPMPLPPGLSVGGLGAPPSLGRLAADPRRHMWGTPTAFRGSAPLYEWDGRRWQTHLPPAVMTGINGLYAIDSLGRIWMTSIDWHPPGKAQPVSGYAVYDPVQDAWTSYATTQDALAAAAALPGMAFLPRRDLYEPPVFSGDGRVTYGENNITVFLYDGHLWRHWKSQDIVPGQRSGYYGSTPRFDSQSRLEVTLPAEDWNWTPDAGWQPSGTQRDSRYVNPVPPGGPKGLNDTPAEDNLGVKWFQWQGAVFTAGYGLWAKQADLSLPGSPFTLGFGIQDVLRDPSGRIFFVSQPTDRWGLVVWSPPPAPKPTVSVTPQSEDSVSVRFSSALSGPHWFLWRVNSGQWSAPTTTKTQAFTALPRGDYRLEVQALDSRLQVSLPAVAVWSVRVDQETQIARWVSTLSAGPDAAREIAVAGLEKQPAAALPALKAARPAASDLGKWWIDAAIQQITDAQKITAGETPKIAN